MLRTHYSDDVPKADGIEVKLAGFVEHIRDLGKIKFLVLRDRKGRIQVTTKDEKIGELIVSIPRESFVVVEGKTKLSNEAPGGVEIIPRKVEVLGPAEKPFPIDISGRIKTSLDKRIDWRFLDMRRPEIMSIFVLESKLVHYMEEFCEQKGLVRIFTSRLTSAATEGGADYFAVLYFDREAFLAQSPQLYKESIMASGIDGVYDVGFVYRAEPHHTPRHLCEYVSFDVELVCEDLEELLTFEEEMLRFCFKKLAEDEEAQKTFKYYNTSLEFPRKIPRLKLSEANEILSSMGEEIGEDLSPSGERKLCEYVKEKYGSDFAFVTHFPFAAKPFYLMRDPKDPSLTLSFDLLYRGLEVTSGGIREHRYDQRVANIKEKGLMPEQYDHLRFFKYGMPPHGGFAIGIERLIMQILGLKNVREATLLPRDPSRLTP